MHLRRVDEDTVRVMVQFAFRTPVGREREAQQAKAKADYVDMERELRERQAKIAANLSRKRREREEVAEARRRLSAHGRGEHVEYPDDEMQTLDDLCECA